MFECPVRSLRTAYKFYYKEVLLITWCIDWTCNCAGDLHTLISQETNVWRSAADISTWLRSGLEWWVLSWSVISAKNAKNILKRTKSLADILPSSEYSLFHARAASMLWTSPKNLRIILYINAITTTILSSYPSFDSKSQLNPIIYLFLLLIVGFRRNCNTVAVNYQIEIGVYEFLAKYKKFAHCFIRYS